MFWSALAAAALLAQDASAQGQAVSSMFRFGCSQLTIERADPLVSPGMNPAPHTHQVVGGNAFNISMEPGTYDPAKIATCTSCTYSEDMSNYWTANVYFRSPENGTYKRVPQGTNGFNGQDGGITVYYMYPYTSENKVTAFKPGFRMVAGDPTLRKGTKNNANVCHRCWTGSFGGAPCDNKDTWAFPSTPCSGGIRSTIIFPSCWDGKNLDSPDHRSHLAYSGTGGGLGRGSCPSSHPIRVPQVMYEVVWDTSGFTDPKYYKDGKQPLVYSFGDPTGFGQHGDYLFGWQSDALQRGMDALKTSGCANANCKALKMQNQPTAKACIKPQMAKEDVGMNGWIKELPGGVELTY